MPKTKQQSLDSFFNPPKRRMTASIEVQIPLFHFYATCLSGCLGICLSHTGIVQTYGQSYLHKIWCKGRPLAKEQFIRFWAYPVKGGGSTYFFYYFCPDYIATSYTLHLHSADVATRLRYLSVLSVGVGNAADKKVSISVFIKLPINYLDLFNN